MPEPNDIPIPVEFNNWVHTATLGHGPATRERVRARALATYQLYFADGIEKGLEPGRARDAAIRKLGDPWKTRSDPDQIFPAGRTPTASGDDILKPIKDYLRRRKTPRPQTLEAWLEIATSELSEEAKGRVQAEIEGHYQDTVAALMEVRYTTDQAEREALADLGSPWVAARQFAKSYLSLSDLERLAQLRDAHHPLWVSITKLMIFILVVDVCFLLPEFGPSYSEFLFLRAFGYLLSAIWGKKCVDSIKAHYILDPHSPNGERRLKRAIIITWSFLIIPWILFFFIAPFFYKEESRFLLDFMIMPLIITGLLIWTVRMDLRGCTALMKKIKDRIQSSNDQGPDQYA